MDLYYKILRTSETGKKFTEIEKRGDVCHEVLKAFLDKYGFQKYRPSRISHIGGISSCVNPSSPLDPKLWKDSGYGINEWMPKLNTKEGKAIMKEINTLPIVDIDELNEVVGYEGNHFKSAHIGFSSVNKTYYGFVLADKWKVTPPSDSEEITASEYKRLFGGETED